jgi:tetratricopeptide (TPR) repeat protein
MRRLWTVLGIVALLCSAPGVGYTSGGGGGGMGNMGGMGGGGMGTVGGARKERSPEKAAQSNYEKGLKKRDNALGHEADAKEASDDSRRDKSLNKARKDWESAIEYYQTAVEKKPDFHEAWSDMGFALRKLERYDESLAAYDKALKIKPDYPNALEYLGEAYLKLNRLEDVRSTYMKLFPVDRSQATLLMTALEEWATRAQTEPPQGIEPAELEAFLTWIKERKELSAQAGEISVSRAW